MVARVESIPSEGTGPVDTVLLDRIAGHLNRSARFAEVRSQPAEAANSVIADYDMGYFPSGVNRAYLRIRCFESDDFSIHYSEQYQDESSWECRWDRHPNGYNSREHFHPHLTHQHRAQISILRQSGAISVYEYSLILMIGSERSGSERLQGFIRSSSATVR